MSKILYTPTEIAHRVITISDKFNDLYQNYDHDQLVFIPILQGAIPFFVDLCKHLHFDPYIEYAGVSSYNGTNQDILTEYKIPSPHTVKDKTVWLFDDLADSGKTLKYLSDIMLEYGCKEVNTCVLIKKRTCTYPVNMYGFEIGSEWIYGYGMDGADGVDGRGRSLHSIWVME